MSRTVLYARVSTIEQTIDHQEAHARAAGFDINEVVADHGVSGTNTKLAARPQGRRLADMLRCGDVLIVRWVDRLGRDYRDVTDTIREFMKRGVIVKTLINGMTFDGATKDPIQQAVRDALIGFMAATAQAQHEATKEAQRAGVAHARENGSKNGGTAYRGRKPSFSVAHIERVGEMLAAGSTISAVAAATGLKRQTIYRIRDNPVEAAAALKKWHVDIFA